MERKLLEAVEAGLLEPHEAMEQLMQVQPLKFTKSPKGLVQVEGLIHGRKTVAFTPQEWKRIAARMNEIIEGVNKA